jgi:hypothetical protein
MVGLALVAMPSRCTRSLTLNAIPKNRLPMNGRVRQNPERRSATSQKRDFQF